MPQPLTDEMAELLATANGNKAKQNESKLSRGVSLTLTSPSLVCKRGVEEFLNGIMPAGQAGNLHLRLIILRC